VPAQNIRVCGIPVDQLFLKKYDKTEIRAKLGIAQERFTVLVVTGSFGIGPIEGIAELLHEDVQMLIVCARNRKLFTRLKKKKYPDIKLFGFVNNIHEMMQVCDCIITKPGGLIVSELLVMELVPIFVCAIPGQETENAKTLAGYGIGVSSTLPERVKQIVLDYKNRPDEILKIKEIIRSIRKPDAVKELYDVVCQSRPGAAHRRAV
jgi:processive 1,2-diacylglycerol beta-glucosyltransferase